MWTAPPRSASGSSTTSVGGSTPPTARPGWCPSRPRRATGATRTTGPVEPAVDLEAARATPLDTDTSYLVEVPVLLVIVADLSKISAVDTGLNRLSIVGGGSVYPFAHNVLLAARDAGYGGHITSVLVRQEPLLRELLHIPDGFAVATVLPLGKPVRELTKLRRDPVEDFATLDTFDGPTFLR